MVFLTRKIDSLAPRIGSTSVVRNQVGGSLSASESRPIRKCLTGETVTSSLLVGVILLGIGFS